MQKKVYQLESQFQSYVKRRLSEIDGLFFFVKEAKSLRGLPDIIGCYKGRFFGWELKRSRSEAQKTTGRIALQRHKLSQIQMAYGIGEIVHPENLEQKLAELLQADPLL